VRKGELEGLALIGGNTLLSLVEYQENVRGIPAFIKDWSIMT